MTRRKARRLRVKRSAKYRRESVTRYERGELLTLVMTARKRDSGVHAYVFATTPDRPMKIVEPRVPEGVERVGASYT